MTGYMVKKDPFAPYKHVFDKFDHIPTDELPTDSPLIAFMNFVICRYLLAREAEGMYALDYDKMRKVLKVTRLNRKYSGIMATFLEDMKYSPFYYGLWSESEPVTLPDASKLQEVPVSKAATMLNTQSDKLIKLADGRYDHIIRMEDDKVTAVGDEYEKMRAWLDEYNTFFTKSNELANYIMENDYTYEIEGKKTYSEIFLLISHDSGKVYDLLVTDKMVDEGMVLPSEIKEVLALLNVIATM